MSPIHMRWLAVSLQLRAATLTPRLSNSPCKSATDPSSVVHTGVKSPGCEKSTDHDPPMYSCHDSEPAVESAVKSGTTSPRRSAILPGAAANQCDARRASARACFVF